jgi:transposase
MANPKDHNNVVLDINTMLTNLSVDEDEKLEDHMKRLDEEFQRQQAQIRKVAEKWYLSHFKVDHHQKVVKEREVKYDSLLALLHQLPIVSNTTPLADIQSVKISFDNRIKIIMEDIENMTHVLENTHIPDFVT